MPVTVNTDLPLHDDRERAWDGDEARRAMASRCSRGDNLMADCMGQGFIWRDPEAEASTIGAYALPVADVIDGDLRLVLSGVRAAANSISPERTPGGPRALEASESELGQMRSAVETILARFAREFDDDDIRAPWEEPSDADEDDTETASAAPAAVPASASSSGCDSCGCGHGADTTENTDTAPERPDEKGAAMPAAVPDQHLESARPRSRVLRASATGGEWRPPVEHFTNPHLGEPTKLTVTADGRVYGHLATWEQPHIGYDGKLVYPPKSSDGAYGYFRQSAVVAASGEVVPVGIITMNTGHADESLSADAAASHYDNTGTMVAAVNVGEDAIGIWLSGSMLPDVSPELRARFGLARVSGDWRQPAPGKPLELIAALSVPNPGFPVRQPAELLASDRLTLAASGLVQGSAGEIRTFICAGATVVDQAQQAALVDAVRSAFGDDFIGQVKDAVIEAINAQAPVSEAPAGPAAPEQAAPAGTAEAAAPAAEAEGEGGASVPAAEGEGEAAPSEEAAPAAPVEASESSAPVPEPGAAGDSPAMPGDTAPAPAAPAAAPAAQVEAGQMAASALQQRVRRQQAKSAHARLMAAAGLPKKA